ncbi:leucine-rich_repeat domain-containing protein [Hexamita inflata]|uniref:Leucine-rich repeat domain-containing protein n=1 Tax=Hexamita inflata TaxID=28002 RepID=A0AA86NL10_9EUKA|nr:leucine-rich repeat domain-containing protein [Hexamita inflata]
MTLSLDILKSIQPNYADAEEIVIPYNSYDNVKILEECTKVQKLVVNYNNISSLNLQKKFEHLKELTINSNQLEALDIIADLVQLNLSCNKFSSLNSLTKYQHLTNLDISNNQLSSQQSKQPLLKAIPTLIYSYGRWNCFFLFTM